jgi:MFS transporter, SP family, solute carrier family 2 (myo-inositol transporter), member 13
MTVVAVVLVDRKGRKFLLRIGTGGIVLCLISGALLFLISFESRRADMKQRVEAAIKGNALSLPIDELTFGSGDAGRPMLISVLYSYGAGDKIATAATSEKDAVLRIVPEQKEAKSPIVIKRAFYGPLPGPNTGWLVAICLGLFISFYSVGPGVVVWLALSELLPTRIRSTGMGIALLLNQGVSTCVAAVFLPMVGNYGYYAVFLFWAGCTVVYFITVSFFLPETKGKTLEEIEAYFEGGRPDAFAQDKL